MSVGTGPDHREGHILVVDDNDMSRMMLEGRVKKLGYVASIAASGAEALQIVERESVDLMLLDLVMEDIDGHEVLARIKADERHQQLPIVIVSGLDDRDSAATCLEAGACEFLQKPVNSEDLEEALSAWLPNDKRPPVDGDAEAASEEDLPDPAQAAVFDPAAILQLRNDFGDENATGFIVKFEELVPEMRDGIVQGSKSGDLTQWRHAAHDLKGGARTMGLSGLAALCRIIEHACHENRAEEAQNATSQLDEYLEKAMNSLREYAESM